MAHRNSGVLSRPWLASFVVTAFLLNSAPAADTNSGARPARTTLKALFIGNSYTARHKLANVVKEMAEAGNPGLTFEPTTVIYGGRTLRDHWRFGTQNYVKLHALTRAEEEATNARTAEEAANREADNARKAEQKASTEAQRAEAEATNARIAETEARNAERTAKEAEADALEAKEKAEISENRATY